VPDPESNPSNFESAWFDRSLLFSQI
jgi:hypothetical protein